MQEPIRWATCHLNLDTGKKAARAAGLRYATGDKPGITRHRRGKGFVFKGPQGQVIRDAKTLARVRALVLPPAWTDVWISTDPRAHLQATGRDAAGRKQYRYHADWTAERDSTKYHRMLAFAEVLPAIRKRTRRDLMGPACCRPRVLATVVELLGKTYIRIGNEEYARDQQVARLDDAAGSPREDSRPQAALSPFAARAACSRRSRSKSRAWRKAVQQCQDLPGQTLFQYRDDQRQGRGRCRRPTSTVTCGEISGGSFTAKDFRTWAGTLTAAQALDDMPPADVEDRGEQGDRRSGRHASPKTLGNTRAVCRKCYIHPAVLDAFCRGVTLSR